MSTLLEAKEVTKIYTRAQHPSLNKVSFGVSNACNIVLEFNLKQGKKQILRLISDGMKRKKSQMHSISASVLYQTKFLFHNHIRAKQIHRQTLHHKYLLPL